MTLEELQAGKVLSIDKPLEWTSFQVVNKMRWMIRKQFGIKKIKIGHAGTLDPLATGLLIVCVGKATKSISKYQGQEKEYTGTLVLGATTPSYDLETEIAYLEERHEQGAEVAATLGMFAPAMGMIGTVIGLVQMLQTMDDPSTIGPAMAVALLTTLYGSVLANLVFIPISRKLENRTQSETLAMAIMTWTTMTFTMVPTPGKIMACPMSGLRVGASWFA